MAVPDPLVWITPSDLGGPQRSFVAVTAALGDAAAAVLHGLEVWQRPTDAQYGLDVEVDAVLRSAESFGPTPCHLFGFSAGATVALAAAIRPGDIVRSVTVFEPASIGDDDWSPVEAAFRSDLAAVRALPVDDRPPAFARLMLPGGAKAPVRDRPPPSWDARTDQLEDMLADVGFVSAELASITTPLLVLTGGDSHPRFAGLADRLVEVMPHAVRADFPDCSHLSPPMRQHPVEVAGLLRELWDRAPQPGDSPAP